jgi:hypothetical protein
MVRVVRFWKQWFWQFARLLNEYCCGQKPFLKWWFCRRFSEPEIPQNSPYEEYAGHPRAAAIHATVLRAARENGVPLMHSLA